MRSRRGLLALGFLTTIAGGVAAFASAEDPESPPWPAPLAFALKASHGYTLSVLGAEARDQTGPHVLLVLRRGGELATYGAPATAVTAGSIDADLGDLGQIHVTFHPSGGFAPIGSPCGDGSPVTGPEVAVGRYEGDIEFRGEGGYTRVSAASAKGDATAFGALICAPTLGWGRGGPGALLTARASEGGARAKLQAIKNAPGAARVLLEAQLSERHAGIAVERSIDLRARSAALTFDPSLRSATLRPPMPFSGSATFRRAGAPAARWRGSLRADFPGHANVLLIGEGASVHLVHGQWTSDHDG